jgi:hypothetical protein
LDDETKLERRAGSHKPVHRRFPAIGRILLLITENEWVSYGDCNDSQGRR